MVEGYRCGFQRLREEWFVFLTQTFYSDMNLPTKQLEVAEWKTLYSDQLFFSTHFSVWVASSNQTSNLEDQETTLSDLYLLIFQLWLNLRVETAHLV